MDSNLSNHSFSNIPQINLQCIDSISLLSNSLNKNVSQIEMNYQNNSIFYNFDLNTTTKSNKFDNKQRSSSMVSEQLVRKDIDVISRNRAGSMFIPNLCIHCKMLEEIQCNNLEGFDDDLQQSSLENISFASSNSSSPLNSSPRGSIENAETQFSTFKEFGQFLEVPKWKPRSSSLDSGIFHNDHIISQSRRASYEDVINQDKPRATSVDIHMQCVEVKSSVDDINPETEKKSSRTRFSIVSVSSRQTILRAIKKLKSSKFHLSPSESKSKLFTYCSEWEFSSQSKEHIWYPDHSVRQQCSIFDCTQYSATETYKCSVCKIVSCNNCKCKINNTCRKTFYRESNNEKVKQTHHWVHKTHYKGICMSCSKNMTSQAMFSNKQLVIALQCSWCKICYHNKKACFPFRLLIEQCNFGLLKDSIVHPAMIEKSLTKYAMNKEMEENNTIKEDSLFISYSIKNSENANVVISKLWKPILVLINPKSGGRQGLEFLNELQWILNPRQVFDINKYSPEQILKLYQSLPNLRILIGGGDGTVNWILQVVEALEFSTFPPMAVIPLGTGNDLARQLCWGSSYNNNDSASKIISDIEKGTILFIDIWKITAENLLSESNFSSSSLTKLPLDSFNNYFSLGSDAATALEFHLDREKNPNRYNSRIKNKLFYAEIGGKDLWKREYKNLVDNISLVCDGISFQSRLSELRPHCILFLNITNYSAGTNPWGKISNNSNFVAQSINDSILEVIGLSAASLATLHIGGQGDRICQCKCAEIVIKRETPIQIDGEPMMIKPCSISVSHKYQYPFIKRESRK